MSNPAALSSGPTILVVDDERNITRLIEVNLTNAGFEVVVAHDGEEAVEQLHGEGAIIPHAIVLDTNMPRMDGLGVLRWLTAHNLGHTPVMRMTAAIGPGQNATSYGEATLSKPFNPRQVVAWVRQVTGVVIVPNVSA